MKTKLAVLLVFLAMLSGCSFTQSPPQGVIVFTSERDGDWEIYRMNLDGSELARLTQDPSEDRGPWWSSVENRINFRSDRSGESSYYSMDFNGGDIQPLELNGSLSPDGTTRVAVEHREGYPQLIATDADSEYQLTSNEEHSRLSLADWSPDGSAILYLAGQGPGSLKIFVLDWASRESTLLTPQEGTHNTGSFSPDGSTILFNSNRTGTMSTFVMDRDGGNVRQLLEDRISAHASWAGDGLIVLDTESAPGVFDVHSIRLDGSALTNLSRSGKDGWPDVRIP